MSFWSRLGKGRAAAEALAQPYGPLVPDWRYKVVRAFADHDDIVHPVGERWTFLRSNFLPYEDGLSLFIMTDSGAAGQIRLQTRPEAQGAIASALHDYLQPEARRPDRHALLVTRDSVCLADDVYAPHPAPLEVARSDDATAVARAILAARYLAWTSTATWSLALRADRIVFGWGFLRRFVTPVDPPLTARADEVDRVHVSYHAQVQPDEIVDQLRHRST